MTSDEEGGAAKVRPSREMRNPAEEEAAAAKVRAGPEARTIGKVDAAWRATRHFLRRAATAPVARAAPVAEPTPTSAVEAIGCAAVAYVGGGLIGVWVATLVPSFFPVLPVGRLAALGGGLCAGLALGGGMGALGSSAFGADTARKLTRLDILQAAALDPDAVMTATAALISIVVVLLSLGPELAAACLAGLLLGFCVAIVLGATFSCFLLGLAVPVGISVGMRGFLSCLAGQTLGGTAGARFWIRWLQDKLLYHPRRYSSSLGLDSEPRKIGGRMFVVEKVSYTLPGPVFGQSDQGSLLLRPHGSDSDTLWVVFGGNAMVGTDWLLFLDNLISMGGPPSLAAFLLVDYPGYGWNTGRPSPAAVLTASHAALKAAVETLDYKTDGGRVQVNLLGHSLGSAAAIQLAVALGKEGGPLGTLICSAPFLSIPHMADVILGGALPDALRPLMPPVLQLCVPHRWDNAALIPVAAKAGWSISLVHGAMDGMVPPYMGRELHRLACAAASSTSTARAPTFTEVPKAGHNDVLQAALPEYRNLMSLATGPLASV